MRFHVPQKRRHSFGRQSLRLLGLFSVPCLLVVQVCADPVSFNWDVRPILSENCLACHGNDAAERKADLLLTDPASVLDESRDGGAVVIPGRADRSELIRRVTASDENKRMPPPESDKTLTADQIAVLRQWIDEGASFEKHWSFVPPEKRDPPAVTDRKWPVNAVDRFILARLEAEGVAPAPAADRRTLIRRVYLDLIGLPPSPNDVRVFLDDNAPGAYERVVDRLLDSPHFGERWGRHWLDAARYADSSGYSEDSPRSIWPYRDWVIDALNVNMPFDRFVVEQLAGDLLPNATLDQRIATGFHRNTMLNEEGGIDEEEFRMYAVIDRVNTTGAVLLGLTVGCAQCHDHKYDPISQEEYYGLFAFFNNDDELDLTVTPKDVVAEHERMEGVLAEKEKALRTYVNERLPDWEATLAPDTLTSFAPPVQEALAVGREQRALRETLLVADAYIQGDERAGALRDDVERYRESIPEVHQTMVLAHHDGGRETHFLKMGDYTRPAQVIEPHLPAVLHPLPDTATGSRLDLAKWIVDPANPLTARVTVNRMWQRLFGRGIVETESDFGSQGALPGHPTLLDWLAVEFVDSGWDVKGMLRIIVTSATYQTSSNARPALTAADPANRLWARQNRIRLDAEIIRDAGLAVSGLLDPTIGGPSVFPPQPGGIMHYGRLKHDWETDEGPQRYRRGLYTYFWRGTPHPALVVFDAPGAITTCTRRHRSTTPLQALTLLNEEQFVEMAEALGKRLSAAPGTDDDRIAYAFNLCLNREATPSERAILQEVVRSSTEQNRWQQAARVMLNLDEFITRE